MPIYNENDEWFPHSEEALALMRSKKEAMLKAIRENTVSELSLKNYRDTLYLPRYLPRRLIPGFDQAFLVEVFKALATNYSLKKIELACCHELKYVMSVVVEALSKNQHLEEIVFYNSDGTYNVALLNIPRLASHELRITFAFGWAPNEVVLQLQRAGVGGLKLDGKISQAIDPVMHRTLLSLAALPEAETVPGNALAEAIRYEPTPSLFAHRDALNSGELAVIFKEYGESARLDLKLKLYMAELQFNGVAESSAQYLAVLALQKALEGEFVDLEKHRDAFSLGDLKKFHEQYEREHPPTVELGSPAAAGAGVRSVAVELGVERGEGIASAAAASLSSVEPTTADALKSFVVKTTGRTSKTVDEFGDLPAEMVSEEQLAYQLYALCGVKVPKSYIVVTEEGRVGLASQILPGYQNFAQLLTRKKREGDGEPEPDIRVLAGNKFNDKPIRGLAEALVAAAWLYDYDAVGKGFDNIGVIDCGRYYQVVKIDPGSACLVELPTGPKLSEQCEFNNGFDPDLERGLILRNFRQAKDWNFYYLFHYVSVEQKRAALAQVAALSAESIREIVFNTAIPDKFLSPERRHDILSELVARRNQIRGYLRFPVGVELAARLSAKQKISVRALTDFYARGEQIHAGNSQPLIFCKRPKSGAVSLTAVPAAGSVDSGAVVVRDASHESLMERQKSRLMQLSSLGSGLFESEAKREALIAECIGEIARLSKAQAADRGVSTAAAKPR